MKTQPYIPLSQRSAALWQEVGEILGVSPDEAGYIYLETFCTTMDRLHFRDWLRRNTKERRKTPVELVKERYARCKPYQPRERQPSDGIGQALDEKNYALKQLIEVGDEVQAHESKTAMSDKGDIEYITKGKWYRVLSLDDSTHDLTEFTAITTTNMPKERNWYSVWSIHALRRDGKVIWEWHAEQIG